MFETKPALNLGLPNDGLQASLVVSVYKDIAKLDCILRSLQHQTLRNFEVIVSEDGEDEALARFMSPWLAKNEAIQHLTQPDQGFRKNRALNRAISFARSDCLVFIDGDCVPHVRFMESHFLALARSPIAGGRRVELGPKFSQRLIHNPDLITSLSRFGGYMRAMPALLADQVKNPESGFYVSWIHRLVEERPLALVGCNFSSRRKTLEAINGFNEDYQAPGIGEDSDLEWRLERAGFAIQNIKFLAPLFHLYHPRGYGFSDRNQQIYDATKSADQWRAERGLSQNVQQLPR
jgi:glycosyltransferase involved in cell wall biosynthesis